MTEKKTKAETLIKASSLGVKGAWGLTKGTLKVAGLAAKPLAKHGGKALVAGAKVTSQYTKDKIEDRNNRKAPLNADNWYEKAGANCENIVDALLNQKSGTTERVVRTLATKLGAAGATVGAFSIASLLGTASTGTAISTLSGAAFQNAALAWIGGSVAAGGVVMFGVAIAGGAVAYFGVRHGLSKITGKKRKKANLDYQEQRVVETCLLLAASFRQQQEMGRQLDPVSASALHNDAMEALSDELDECIAKVSYWPAVPLRRLNREFQHSLELKHFLKKTGDKAGHKPGMIGVPIVTGVISAVIIKLLAEDLPNFSVKEELVLDALRRSNNSLTNASNDQLAEHVQSMNIDQIAGLKNSVKGIYHELAFQYRENNDGDEYVVELFELTNHPGADVRIVNTLTGDVTTAQLKATNYAAYVREHNARYEDITVFATSEVADGDASISSSKISNEEITQDTDSVLGTLGAKGDADILDSMGVAAMVILSRNVGAFLKGETVPGKRKELMIQDGIVAASVAGLANLLL